MAIRLRNSHRFMFVSYRFNYDTGRPRQLMRHNVHPRYWRRPLKGLGSVVGMTGYQVLIEDDLRNQDQSERVTHGAFAVQLCTYSRLPGTEFLHAETATPKPVNHERRSYPETRASAKTPHSGARTAKPLTKV